MDLFHDKSALLHRLTIGAETEKKEVVFVVGSAISGSAKKDEPGVADVPAVVELIRSIYAENTGVMEKLETKLASSSNKYQAAFEFLSGHSGPDVANQIVRQAVLKAYDGAESTMPLAAIAALEERTLIDLAKQDSKWHLAPGVDAIGEIIASQPQKFGSLTVTSNFDPLIEISVRRHGGQIQTSSMSNDGSVFGSVNDTCQCIHIHGYWHGQDTLHTVRQLTRSRSDLHSSLLHLLKDKLVVVIAYGGWDDVFTTALEGVVSDNHLYPEILWCMYSEDEDLPDHLAFLSSGLDRGRVSLYKGIDCHAFLPELCEFWKSKLDPATTGLGVPNSSPGGALKEARRMVYLPSLECDRPPSLDIWVGRENELRALELTKSRVLAITGIGGQGKSALVARYLEGMADDESNFKQWDWRDCKEQADRIRTQILGVIERIVGVNNDVELGDFDDIGLVEFLLDAVVGLDLVIVFDNVDHYVDLETKRFTGLLEILVERFSDVDTGCRLILTCRPTVQYVSRNITSFEISPVSRKEAIDLFTARSGSHRASDSDIFDAHEATKGHVFWLDLIAGQVARTPGLTLRNLLDGLHRELGAAPDVLSSIWDRLAERERLVLRLMAEARRPETEETVRSFVRSELTHAKFQKALRSLIGLNLIVVKKEENAADLYDLHPLVRTFVRNKFMPNERKDFIAVVIGTYDLLIGKFAATLSPSLPYRMLERWSQKAELQKDAGLIADAITTILGAEDALVGAGHVEEYVRTTKNILDQVDWEIAPTEYEGFDRLVSGTIHNLEALGQQSESNRLLERYEDSIPGKTARFIGYCNTKAYVHWVRKDYATGEEWALRGVELKDATNVDTVFDCQHTLALIRRDNGDPEGALPTFLAGETLDTLLDPVKNRHSGYASMFGNVGRCLHFMKDIKGALVCYRRAALLLENDGTLHKARNQTFAREWIANIMRDTGKHELEAAFLIDAKERLGKTSYSWTASLQSQIDVIPLEALPNSIQARRLTKKWLQGNSTT